VTLTIMGTKGFDSDDSFVGAGGGRRSLSNLSPNHSSRTRAASRGLDAATAPGLSPRGDRNAAISAGGGGARERALSCRKAGLVRSPRRSQTEAKPVAPTSRRSLDPGSIPGVSTTWTAA